MIQNLNFETHLLFAYKKFPIFVPKITRKISSSRNDYRYDAHQFHLSYKLIFKKSTSEISYIQISKFQLSASLVHYVVGTPFYGRQVFENTKKLRCTVFCDTRKWSTPCLHLRRIHLPLQQLHLGTVGTLKQGHSCSTLLP